MFDLWWHWKFLRLPLWWRQKPWRLLLVEVPQVSPIVEWVPNGDLYVVRYGTNSLLLLQLALSGAVLHHMALLATVITDIKAHSTLPNMELATCVTLDTFGLFVGLTVVALPISCPFWLCPWKFLFLLLFFQFEFWGYLFWFWPEMAPACNYSKRS